MQAAGPKEDLDIIGLRAALPEGRQKAPQHGSFLGGVGQATKPQNHQAQHFEPGVRKRRHVLLHEGQGRQTQLHRLRLRHALRRNQELQDIGTRSDIPGVVCKLPQIQEESVSGRGRGPRSRFF